MKISFREIRCWLGTHLFATHVRALKKMLRGKSGNAQSLFDHEFGVEMMAKRA